MRCISLYFSLYFSKCNTRHIKTIASISQLANPPNVDAHVFCVATRDCAPFALDGTTDVIELLRGQVALLPYAPLRPLLAEGAVLLA